MRTNAARVISARASHGTDHDGCHRARSERLPGGRPPRRRQGARPPSDHVAAPRVAPARGSFIRISKRNRNDRNSERPRVHLLTPRPPPYPQAPKRGRKASPAPAAAAADLRGDDGDDARATTTTTRVLKTASVALGVSLLLDQSSAGPAHAVTARLEGTETARVLEAAADVKKGKKPSSPATAPATTVKRAVPASAGGRAVPGVRASSAALPEVKYEVPAPVKKSAASSKAVVASDPVADFYATYDVPVAKPVTKAVATMPVAAPAAAPKKAAAPTPSKPKPSSSSSSSKAYSSAQVVKTAPIPKTAGQSSTAKVSGKAAKANLAELKVEAPEATKGAKRGMQLSKEKPKTRLEKIAAGGGLAALGFGAAKAGAGGAAKGAGAKAAVGATVVDAYEAAAVVVAGGAVSGVGNSVIARNSRVRNVRKTPDGELPLPIQTALALSIPASFAFTIFQVLQSL